MPGREPAYFVTLIEVLELFLAASVALTVIVCVPGRTLLTFQL